MSISPISSPLLLSRMADRTPVHRALDALTALTLDAQRLHRALPEGAVVTAAQRDAMRRIEEQLQQLRISLGAVQHHE